MIDYTPLLQARVKHGAPTIGARIANEIITTFADAVEFYGTQGEAKHVRSSGTEWLRENFPGHRLTVQRAAPMDRIQGRSGLWEATIVRDMNTNRPSKHMEES